LDLYRFHLEFDSDSRDSSESPLTSVPELPELEVPLEDPGPAEARWIQPLEVLKVSVTSWMVPGFARLAADLFAFCFLFADSKSLLTSLTFSIASDGPSFLSNFPLTLPVNDFGSFLILSQSSLITA